MRLALPAAALLFSVAMPTLSHARQAPTTAPAATPQDVRRVDLDLPDTNVRDYVDYLQQATGCNIILLVDEGVDASKIAVPRLKLRSLALDDAVNILGTLPGTTGDVNRGASDEIVPTYTVRVHARGVARDDGGNPLPVTTRIFPLERLLFADAGGNDPPAQAARAKLLAEKTPQAMELIEQALMLQSPDGAVPQMRLHEATHTLLVKGTPEQLAVVDQAIQALAVPAMPEGELQRRVAEAVGSAVADRASMQREMAEQNQRLQMTQARLDRAEEAYREAKLELDIATRRAADQQRSAATPAIQLGSAPPATAPSR